MLIFGSPEILAGSYKFSPIRYCVRPSVSIVMHFLGTRSLVFYETSRSAKNWQIPIFGQNPILGYFVPKRAKSGPNEPFCHISRFHYYLCLKFVPKCASYSYKSDCTIRLPGKIHFFAIFGKNTLSQSDPRFWNCDILWTARPIFLIFCSMSGFQEWKHAKNVGAKKVKNESFHLLS